jgi:hypothetical protein
VATFTFGRGHPFPAGTTVSAYEDLGQKHEGEPHGVAATSSGVVAADGSLSISGLTEGKRYWAAALVGGVWRWTYLLMRTSDVTAGEPLEVADEGNLLPLRRRMNFSGSGVTATDDPTGAEIDVVVGGVPGPPGGNALGVDVWATELNPEAITDWGPPINTLIAGSGPVLPAKRLNFRDKPFPCTTGIDLRERHGVVFEGEGAPWRNAFAGNWASGARLIWKGGAGSGSLLRCNPSDGLKFEGLGIFYDNAAYNGDLIDMTFRVDPFTWGAGGTFERCQIGHIAGDGSVVSARTLLNWNGQIQPTLRECALAGAQRAVMGQYNMNSDDAVIDNCVFNSFSVAVFTNVGRYWQFRGNVFLMGSFGGSATPYVIDCEDHGAAGTGMGTNLFTDFHWESNRVWDRPGNSSVFRQKVEHPWYVTADGDNFVYLQDGAPTVTEFQFGGPGELDLRNMRFTRQFSTGSPVAFIDLGVAPAAAKESVLIENLRTVSNTINLTGGQIANIAGHKNVRIIPGRDPNSDGLVTLYGHERVRRPSSDSTRRYTPAIALAAGQTAVDSIGIYGSDSKGVIVVQSSGSGLIAGALGDITFSVPMVSDPDAEGAGVTVGSARIVLTPLDLRNWPSDFNATVDAGVGASISAAASLTGWRLSIRNAVTGSKRLVWSYDVVKL